MKIAVVADSTGKEELLAQGLATGMEVEWLTAPAPVPEAEAYIDLLFRPEQERIDQLNTLQPAFLIVNSVAAPLNELKNIPVRIQAWQGFLKRGLLEASCTDENVKAKAAKVFSSFNKTVEWVPDIPGFISARVIAMIINEAYFTLEEKVSSKEEIDTAMKLGTNYPFGPFEWSEKIGLRQVYELLQAMSKTNARYSPADLLKKEAFPS